MNNEQVSALILAAGSGQRLGGKPKAFLKWEGRTFLERAVEAVAPFAAEIIVGVRSEDLASAKRLLPARVKIVAGGSTRQKTVSILLGQATRPIVLLHEVARPFIETDLFRRILEVGARYGAAVICCPIKSSDSLGLCDGRVLDSLVPRSRVVALQTPHVYRRTILVRADTRALKEGWELEGTAAMVKRAGFPVRLVPGSAENIKITYKEDLALLRRTSRRKR